MRYSEISSNTWMIVLFVIFCCLLSARVNQAEDAHCRQFGVCACVFDNRSKIDLSHLGSSTGVPLINDFDVDGVYTYSFNPCYPFNEGDCVNVAACQSAIGKDFNYAIGDASDPVLTYNTSSGILTGKYSSYDSRADNRKTSYVSFICDPAAEKPRLEAFGESPTLTYRFAITSKHACITQDPTPAPSKGCNTNYGDFIKRCEVEYDGHEEPVKVLFIRNWNGKCQFPSNKYVAITIYAENSTCAGVTNRCNPAQAFSVNGEVCKELNYRNIE